MERLSLGLLRAAVQYIEMARVDRTEMQSNIKS
jgi:hypothetical protein